MDSFSLNYVFLRFPSEHNLIRVVILFSHNPRKSNQRRLHTTTIRYAFTGLLSVGRSIFHEINIWPFFFFLPHSKSFCRQIDVSTGVRSIPTSVKGLSVRYTYYRYLGLRGRARNFKRELWFFRIDGTRDWPFNVIKSMFICFRCALQARI